MNEHWIGYRLMQSGNKPYITKETFLYFATSGAVGDENFIKMTVP